MSQRARRWLQVLLWLALTVAIVLAAPRLPWQRAVEHARTVRGPWVFAAVAANLAILPLWALEWRLLVPGAARVAYARMLEVVCVTAAVLNSVPWFAGEAAAVGLLIGRAGLSRGAALSVLAMDQLLVGLAKLSVIAAAAVFTPLPSWLRAGILSLAAGFGVLLVLLLPLASRWTAIRDRLLASPSRLRVAAATLAGWGAHLDVLRDAGRFGRVAILALAKKGAELLAILAIQAAFGMSPSVTAGAVVLAALAVTTLLPVAPANLGVYEATVYGTYRYMGVPAEAALGLAVVQHLCFLLPSIAAGYVVLTRRQMRLRGLRAS